MSTSKRFRVVPQEQGMTLRNLLIRRVHLDRDRAAELIRAGGVYVNRLRVRLPQVLVAAGERVTVYTDALDVEPLALERLVFVHRDPEFVILDKPPGVPVAAVRETALGCLSEALIRALEAEGVSRPYVGLVHRLDRGASGLVLFTIRGVANKSMHKQFRDHEIRRRYRVRVRAGEGVEVSSGAAITCEAPLLERREGGVRIAAAGEAGAMAARTHFRHVAALGGHEHLFDVELETGRTHQIRAHAAHLGFPVVGDRRYGGEAAAGEGLGDSGVDRLCLHAHRLRFTHPRTGEAIEVEASLPDWAQAPVIAQRG